MQTHTQQDSLKHGGEQPGKTNELIENLIAPKSNKDSPHEKISEPDIQNSEKPVAITLDKDLDQGKRQRDTQQNQQLEKEKEKRPNKKRHLLSFGDEVGEFEQEQPVRKPKVQDKSRKSSNQAEQQAVGSVALQNHFREEYLAESQRMKEEFFELQYSYWDTNNVVKKLRRKKKEKIIDMLDICRLQLIEHFQGLVKSSPDDLLFVIKDFIVPHNMSIYEVEVLDIKDKTGEKVLNFHKVKLKKDHKEVEISVNLDGPIRIVERARYQKNKATYPFINWHTLHLTKPK